MKLLRYNLIVILGFCFLYPSFGENISPDQLSFDFEILGKNKEFYSPGDTISVKIIAVQNGQECSDGVERSRLFVKGMRIDNQNSWEKTGTGVWEKTIVAVVGECNNNKLLQLTAYRKTDQGEVAKSLKLKAGE